jgi:hypothetical protein
MQAERDAVQRVHGAVILADVACLYDGASGRRVWVRHRREHSISDFDKAATRAGSPRPI